MSKRVVVAGVGMIPFKTPRNAEPYGAMGEQAARKALADAGVDYTSVQQAYVGYVYGDSTSGQAALYGLGQSGIPIMNVNNNCSTGSTALFLALKLRRPLFLEGEPGVGKTELAKALAVALGRELLRLATYEPVSENPVFSFDFPGRVAGGLRLVGTDNNGNRIDSRIE